jgi:phage terminase large subunit-like protein
MYQNGFDEQKPTWAHWQLSSYENPHIPRSELDEMTKTLPERVVRQEIYAEFVEDAGGVFRHVIERATAVEQAQPVAGHSYIIGVDVATLVDFTVASVIDVETKEMVYIDRFNKCDYSILYDRLYALYKRYNANAMTIEANAIGQAPIDELASRGLSIIPFYTTNATKQAAVQALQAAFEHGEIKILNDPVLIGELQAFEASRTASGSWKYAAPEGMHDDTVMSLMIAWHGIGGTLDVW